MMGAKKPKSQTSQSILGRHNKPKLKHRYIQSPMMSYDERKQIMPWSVQNMSQF